ncbi:predicted extracellular nuclease [Sanguibacter keddieii DSM 10542]|uniref:Predicted extracellular nuclease n=1 Tax=Sanguibacter keddieii (strain ATCC 51767 / DSM 10542 / NCFB 3025 / ST-74) TaxID=446469 RepID=D1BE27_SANKS|nr:predicted extracellular nuclease [Sanguibacter keddieii DSM 10542]
MSPSAAVIIDEVYGGGGNSGATLKNDFVTLHNTTDQPVTVDGWSIRYAAAGSGFTAGSQSAPLTGEIPAKGSYLVQLAPGAGGTLDLPTPDAQADIPAGAANGTFALVSSTDPLVCAPTACATDPAVVDLVGYGTAATFAGTAPAPVLSATTSASRTDFANTGDNAADFVAGAPTPVNSNGDGPPVPPPPEDAGDLTIAQIQGTGPATPYLDQQVSTSGYVTASYPTGGYNGFVIQEAGTGLTCPAEGEASSALFVYTASAPTVAVGDYVDVTGVAGEYDGLTQIATPTVAPGTAEGAAPVAAECAWPATDAGRESLESMLVLPQGGFTVTNTYTTHQYGEVGLAVGDSPLLQPTDVAPYGTPAHDAVVADNAARGVVLDDGASWNYLSSPNNASVPPYVTADGTVRVGASVEFTDPVVVDFRNGTWKLNPTSQVTPADVDAYPVVFSGERPAAPDTAAIGDADVTVAAFNVLNYFTTTGSTVTGCSSYTDRTGAGITTNTCPGNGPRGAWDADNLERQQDKIVDAITRLDADVVGLMEIENSAALGEAPDEAVGTLVAALNAEAGEDRWAFVESPADLPAVADQDVISGAIIYQTAAVTPVGESHALGTLSGAGQTFVNAREPIGQAFEPADGGKPFFVVANHFKSKSAGGASGAERDLGQGAWNAARTAQATALATWVDETALPAVSAEAGVPVEDVLLLGDFNAYTHEDPLLHLYGAGYQDATTLEGRGELTYSYQGLNGSLDHVLLNESAAERFTGSDVWEINAPESIALEYSRFNVTAGDFYRADAFRSSDHDPVVVGLTAGEPAAEATETTLTLLNINDFHGRIGLSGEDGSGPSTVAFAGTVEEERAAAGEDSTLFLSAGDNIGASLFTSAIQQDQPTIDVLNTLELASSAVGNHEFDKGFDDLTGRVSTALDAPYLGANVYTKGTREPALDEYSIHEVDGVRVAVIGVVTQETPSLVTPAGIADLEFGDPVDAVNRVAAQLTDGDESNGEADVIVAEYHEGAGAGTPDGATLAEEVAGGGAFAKIVTGTSPAVDVIFTGHTHKQYAWDAPVPGTTDGSTRPILQTGSYGEFLGKVTLDVDLESRDVVDYTAVNVPRTTTPEETLVATYPRVAEVERIVADAVAYADEIGSQPVGSVTADITTAFAGGSVVDGAYTGGERDDRAEASTLGTLVGNALRDSLSALPAAPDFGVVNSGGLREELLYGSDGVVTFAEALAVLPFANDLTIVTLSGEQVVTMLEQQWQRTADGEVPSRPYLQLGLSDNVSYTYDEVPDPADPTLTVGVVRSVTIDGEPIDLAADYRIGTFSFLASGGDNFRVFADASETVNTGLLDWEGWVQYLQDNSPVAPSYARSGVQVSGAEVVAGEGLALTPGLTTTVTLDRLDLRSLGSPANTTVTATLGETEVGTATVTDGSATVELTVPEGVVASELTFTAAPSGTVAVLPVALGAQGSEPTVTLSSTEVVAGGTLDVRVEGGTPGLATEVWLNSEPVLLGSLVLDADGAGTLTVTIPLATAVGDHTIRVLGDGIDVSAALTVLAADGSGAGAGSGDGLASTGGDVLSLAVLAALALVGGGLLVARRRQQA